MAPFSGLAGYPTCAPTPGRDRGQTLPLGPTLCPRGPFCRASRARRFCAWRCSRDALATSFTPRPLVGIGALCCLPARLSAPEAARARRIYATSTAGDIFKVSVWGHHDRGCDRPCLAAPQFPVVGSFRDGCPPRTAPGPSTGRGTPFELGYLGFHGLLSTAQSSVATLYLPRSVGPAPCGLALQDPRSGSEGAPASQYPDPKSRAHP